MTENLRPDRTGPAKAPASDLFEPADTAELAGMLLAERPDLHGLPVPDDPLERWRLVRALMNTREPVPAADALLELQDGVLARIRDVRGTTEASSIAPLGRSGRTALWQGDITTLAADAVVNAANSGLLGCFVPNHRCIDNAIHTFAGMQLRLACNDIMQVRRRDEPTGTATLTPAFNLPAERVMHTVGPVTFGTPSASQERELASCYTSCLEAAAEEKLESIAFCCISTGEFRFPRERAAEIALRTVDEFLARDTTLETVVFNVFTDEDRVAYERLLVL